jgi:hypothetical protein
MTSLNVLQLVALSNLTLQKIRDGIAAKNDENAYYIFHLSMKYRHCEGTATLAPVKLLDAQLDAAKEVNEQAMDRGIHELAIKNRVWRLEIFLDEICEEVEEQLKHCATRTQAAIISRAFCLGREGIRIWERAHIKRKPLYQKNSRSKAAVKRKQPPTAATPADLSPPPPATSLLDNNQDDPLPESPAIATTEDVKDESEEHDPPAFTRDTSITRIKTRFAKEQTKPSSSSSSPAPSSPLSSSLLDSNSNTTDWSIRSSTIPNGATPPGDDEFAAIEAMMTCKDGLKGNDTEIDKAAVETVLDTPLLLPTTCPVPCSAAAISSVDGMEPLTALHVALAAEKSRKVKEAAGKEKSCVEVQQPLGATEISAEKDQHGRGLVEDIQQENVCV